MFFDEQFLRFEFDDAYWQIIKLDEHSAYRNGIEKLDQSKAVDFLGIWDGRDLYFIEIKDFRGSRIQNENRLTDGELPIELGQKVRDSIACTIGAYRTQGDFKEWEPFVRILADRNQTIKVVLWLEYDLPASPKRRKVSASTKAKVFQKKLRWLTPRVMVVSMAESSLPNTSVNNLPRNKPELT